MSNWVASLQLLTIGFADSPCVRYWTDGAVIGSELFGSDRAEPKRLVKGSPPGVPESRLFTRRQLNPTL